MIDSLLRSFEVGKRTALAFLALPLFSVSAELSFQHSEDFGSFKNGISFEADALPETGASIFWVRNDSGNGSTASATEGVLIFQTAAKDDSTLYWSAKRWTGKESVKTGFTVEARIKVKAGGEFSLVAASGNGVADDEVLTIREDSVIWGSKVVAKDLVNTDRFHTYRLAKWADGGGYDLWRDGEPIAEGEKGSLSLEDRFWFGNWNGAAGGAEVDYLRWDAAGAYCP